MKNITKHRILLTLLTACGLFLSSCKDDFKSPESPSGITIFQTISASQDYNILAAALVEANLSGTLDSNIAGPFTLFAPTDDAFITYLKTFTGSNVTDEASAIVYVNTLKTTGSLTISGLVSVLNSHLLNAVWTSDKLVQGLVVTNLSAGRTSVSKQGSSTILNGISTITVADVSASNGVIHAIDKVMPAVTTASPFVTFGLTINYGVSPAAITGGTTTGATNNYDLFAAIIRLSGLATTLLHNASPLPDFTYFAPDDVALVAYAKTIDATVIDEASAYTKVISKLSSATALAIVNYHVISGRILTTDMTNEQQFTTLAGKPLTIEISGSTYTVKDANTTIADPTITSPNGLTNGGVVHKINGVLRAG